MASYLTLLNWTEQGIKNVKQSPDRLEAVKQAARDAGGRVIFFYMLMGQYDLATLVRAPGRRCDVAARSQSRHGGQCEDDDDEGIYRGRLQKDPRVLGLISTDLKPVAGACAAHTAPNRAPT